MMLEGAGFEIIDPGTDVSPEKSVKAVVEHKPKAIATSAPLTTTIPNMQNTISALGEAAARQRQSHDWRRARHRRLRQARGIA